ncbi:uncharacterized protein BO80DRAFT_391970 [Aspergillus ibericus CBS 121593]|uniref:C2H2-type domain-containing protein n=1 Tax=Aspergillus ibericus CBS 121593 TaxID=1448316 RepID=A0A395GLM6_9EURO|nr:hypothetical protein BO80DRAFT_391970 [Aspergillus ibericus CBS 121593]RAK96411.1 hypothetical protein BO80DRAFT_391970 [Aspergillus ibericus CBS 121593]
MANPISSSTIACLKELKQLVLSGHLAQYESDVSQVLWQDELGRLQVWAANIGAHQTGQSSLDHRLRDASHIKEQTVRLLKRLRRIYEDLQDVLHGPIEDDSLSDTDDDGDQTEVQQLYHALHDTINSLFQLSMAIQRPAHHDRLLGTRRSDVVHFECFDQQHVSNKFPQAEDTIAKRLGLAITQRRAVLQYRERHHLKLGRGLNHALGDHPDTVSTKLSETVATEFIETSHINHSLDSQSIVSQTSYAETLMNGSGGMVVPPPPAESADGNPFECPYCFVILTIPNRSAWARHIFKDLMPYICLFPDCQSPHRLYDSRREWDFHIQSEHSTPGDDGHLFCPLCHAHLESTKLFEKHVGRHLEELALFALPQLARDEDDNSSMSVSGPLNKRADAQPGYFYDTLSDIHSSFDGSEHAPDDGRVFRDQDGFSVDEMSISIGPGELDTASTRSQGSSEEVSADQTELQSSSPKPVDTEKDQAIARLERLILEERTERETREAREAQRHAALEAEVGAAAAAAAAAAAGPRAESDHVEATEAAAEASPTHTSKKKPIRFKDAIGRKFSFPFALCCTWQGMEELIRQAFLHIEVIGPHIAEGHYDLIGPNGDIILPHDWERVIEPDWLITMHMWPIPEKKISPDLDPSSNPPPPPIPSPRPPNLPFPGDSSYVPKIDEEPSMDSPKDKRRRGPEPGSFAMWMVGGNRLKLNRALKNRKGNEETGELRELATDTGEDVDKTIDERSEQKPADESSPVVDAAGTPFTTSSEHNKAPAPDPGGFAQWMARGNRSKFNRAPGTANEDNETASRTAGNE